MRGTIIRRGRKWVLVLDLGEQAAQRCPSCSNGRAKIYWTTEGRLQACPSCAGPLEDTRRRRREWHSGFDRKRDAQSARLEILGRLARGEHVTPSRQSLAEYLLEEWLPARQAKVEPNTAEIEALQVRAYIVPRLGSRALQDLTPAALEAFYVELAANGRRHGTGGLAPKTVKNVHGILRKALGDAVRLGKVSRNAAEHAEPPKVARTEKRVWNRAQLRAFLERVRSERLGASWWLAATTGLRRSEVLGLPWEALNLEVGRLSVRQKLVEVGRESIIRKVTKTSSSRRTIALDPETVRVLREWQERQLFERLEWEETWIDSGLVFTNEDGSPVNPTWWSRTFARHVRDAGLPPIPAKNARHTHATLALEAGTDLRVVSGRLGHASVAITGDVYASFVDRMDRQAAEQTAALVFGD